jgi:sialate O-acetylesterase
VGLPLAFALALSFVPPATADVKLPAIFGDHMVLQADTPVRVWGWADAGEQVKVEIQNQSASAEAGADGAWQVTLEPLNASAEPTRLVVAGRNRIEIEDVLVGEVWLCAGQSNMWWPVSRTTDARREIQEANDPRLRLFTVPVDVAAEPQPDLADTPTAVLSRPPQPKITGRWAIASPETIGDFSGVAYYFGRDLMLRQDRPVGIIAAAVGGTIVSSWTSRAALADTPSGAPILAYWDQYARELYPAKRAEYEQQKAAWESAQTSGEAEPGDAEPKAPLDPSRYVNTPTALFNAMISPITGYTLRGVTWYQGESNAVKPSDYAELLSAMVRDWRRAWEDADLPFAIVQLPSLDTSHFSSLGGAMDWPLMREAQDQVAEDNEAVGVAVTIDLGVSDDAHPPNKQEIAERLILTAEALAYGRDREFTGPAFDTLEVDGSSVWVSFDHVGDGLEADGGEVLGFEVAGADGIFHPAEAEIEGKQVQVSSQAVPSPEAVRYAWLDDPRATLRNAAGLPAAPFRSDERQPQVLDAGFETTPTGFWNVTGQPMGWSASDPARVYTAALGFALLSPGTHATGQPVPRPAANGPFMLTARLGADPDTTARVILEATENPDGSGLTQVLTTLAAPGVGNYQLDPVQSEPFEIASDLEAWTLRVKLEVQGSGTAYFDELTLEPAS